MTRFMQHISSALRASGPFAPDPAASRRPLGGDAPIREQAGHIGFARDKQGSAVIEFVIMAPILITLFLGVMEVSRFLMVNEKTDAVTSTMADLVSQEKSGALTNAEINVLFNAASQVMQPYPFGTEGVVIVSSVTQNGAPAANNPPVVSWQRTGGGSFAGGGSQIGTPGMPASMPVGFTMAAGDNIIVAETYYNFTTLFGTAIIGSTVLYKTAYYKPRLGSLSVPPT